MVVIHVKQSDAGQFLYECHATQSIHSIITDIVSIYNLQSTIQNLRIHGEQLLLYGPAKSQYVGDFGEENSASPSSNAEIREPIYNSDPSGRRIGEACDPTAAETLRRMLLEAEAYVSKNQIIHKVPLALNVLKDHIQNIRGAVMSCYPMGLPDFDPVQQLLVGTFKGGDCFDQDTAQLWWAGKELTRDKKLCDHVGKNEKTKIIAKLQASGHGPPSREPPDAEIQRATVAWYQKQHEVKKSLVEDEDDLNMKSFVNTKFLKAKLQGLPNINYK